jgi:hypothetical protein
MIEMKVYYITQNFQLKLMPLQLQFLHMKHMKK